MNYKNILFAGLLSLSVLTSFVPFAEASEPRVLCSSSGYTVSVRTGPGITYPRIASEFVGTYLELNYRQSGWSNVFVIDEVNNTYYEGWVRNENVCYY